MWSSRASTRPSESTPGSSAADVAREHERALRAKVPSRRWASMARRFAVVMSHPAGMGRYAGGRPLLERGDQRLLGDLLGQTDVAGDPGEPGDEAAGLDAPHRLDGARRRGVVVTDPVCAQTPCRVEPTSSGG